MKFIHNILLGCLISLSVSYTITTIRALIVEGRQFTGTELLQELCLALALGIVLGAATLILQSEHLIFPLLVLIHFCIVQITVFTVGAFANWYEFTTKSMLIMFGIIVTVYILTWCIVLVFEKREINKLNEMIRKGR